MSVTDTTTDGEGTRRDFIYLLTGGVAAAGAAGAIWPLVDQMNPAANVRALSSKDVDISQIEVGQAIKVLWRGKPVFIRHRTEKEIAEAEGVDVSTLRDPQTDAERVTSSQGVVRKPWLIVIGVCTHLGCIPLGTEEGEPRGDYDGWFCPCHGSEYDTAGRIRRGPAPKNLYLPPYTFLNDTSVKIG